MAKQKAKPRCGRCGRVLKEGKYVYDRFSKKRYCYIGHCKGDRERRAVQSGD